MTMNFKTVAIVAVVFLTAFCVQKKKGDVEEVKPQPAPVVFMAIDGTRSYRYFEHGKMKLKKLVEFLPAGSRVFVRLISSDSYHDNNSIITKELPIPVEASKNVFDKRKRIERIKNQLAIKKAKEEIWAAILNAKSPRSWYSDIYGFLLVCFEKIRQSSEGRPVYILILTDLENNRRKYRRGLRKGCLTGAKVYFLAFENTSWEHKENWREFFIKLLGTEEPVFLSTDEEVQDIFSENKESK